MDWNQPRCRSVSADAALGTLRYLATDGGLGGFNEGEMSKRDTSCFVLSLAPCSSLDTFRYKGNEINANSLVCHWLSFHLSPLERFAEIP